MPGNTMVKTLMESGPMSDPVAVAARAALARNDLVAARQGFAEALRQHPDDPGLLKDLGQTLIRLQRPADARATLERALILNPDDAVACFFLGVALALDGQAAAALAQLDRATQLQPRMLNAWLQRGGILKSLGRFAEAASCFAAVTELDPRHALAWRERASVLAPLERHADLLHCLQQVITLVPGDIGALKNAAVALTNLDRFAEAAQMLSRAIGIQPQNAELHGNLARTCAKARQPQAAMASVRRALDLNPDDPAVLRFCGEALIDLHHFDQAVPLLERGVQQHPQWAPLHSALGMAYDGLSRYESAVASFEQALKLNPHDLESRLTRSLLLLGLGRLREGFAEYEVRWQRPPLNREGPPSRRWRGDEALAGKTLLLNCEQGLGDNIQFIRYAGMAAAQGARVIVRVPASLVELFQTVKGVAGVVSESEALPPHDFHCPMMSLAAAFGTSLETIPATVPYLTADAARVSAWRQRLWPATRPRIGLVWAGRQYHPVNYNRDTRLECVRPLLDVDAEWISLQKEIPAADRNLLEATPQLRRYGEQLRDFSDTAALVGNLDLVISVDTAVVHLAGAMAKPVWLLNRFSGCWRWLHARSDSPWYPTARIFRQQTPAQWGAVVDEMRLALGGWREEHDAQSGSSILPAQERAETITPDSIRHPDTHTGQKP